MEELLKNHTLEIEFLLKKLPWILIIFWGCYSSLIILFKTLRRKYSNFYIIESIPNVFVTLGLFRTFTGIAYGLLYFDTSPDQIKQSIKTLLDGLKLAMFTSITGILLSLIFSKIIEISIRPPESPELFQLRKLNYNFETLSKTLSETQHKALVEALKEVLSDFNQIFKSFVNELVEKNFEELNNTINQLCEWQKQHKDDVKNLTNEYKNLVSYHAAFSDKTKEWVSRLDEISGQSSKLQIVIDKFNDAFNEDGNLSAAINKIKEVTFNLDASTKVFKDTITNMQDAAKSIKQTGENVTTWTTSIENVSEQAQAIVDKVSTLRTINIEQINSLVNEFDKSLKGTLGTFDELILKYIESIENRISDN